MPPRPSPIHQLLLPYVRSTILAAAAMIAAACIRPAYAFSEVPQSVERAGSVTTAWQPPEADLTDTADLSAFVDGLFQAHMAAHHIPGGTVSIVREGEVLLARGYGLADRESGRRVEAARTLFRVGSITKLFTWTALMQLVERGMVDLDADVNRYLTSVEVADAFGSPVTPRHLLTHTVGFEDRIVRLFARDPASIAPLPEYMRDHMPIRIYSPGQRVAYSNHGTALAGLLVQEVTDRPLYRYVEEEILAPLDMASTSMRQPLPDSLARRSAIGYLFEGGLQRAIGPEYVPPYPAGSLQSTATDMARFMIAYLNGGARGDARILQSTTIDTMWSRQFAPHPEAAGIGLGFIESRIAGRSFWGHGGDTRLFHALVILDPEREIGLFMSFNGAEGAKARASIAEAFVERYFRTRKVTPLETAGSFSIPIDRFAGYFLTTRRPVSRADKLAALTGLTEVSRLGPGSILTSGGFSEAQEWVRTDSLVFQERTGRDQLYFEASEEGEITRLISGTVPVFTFERAAWHQKPPLHGAALGTCVLLFLTVLRWPWQALRGRVRAKRSRNPVFLPRLARWTAGLSALLGLTFLTLTGAALADPFELAYGIPDLMQTALYLPIAMAFLTPVAVGFSAASWHGGYWSRPARIHYSLVTGALILFLVVLDYWNLLGVHV